MKRRNQKQLTRDDIASKEIRFEYVDGTQTLNDVLRQHLNFCLFYDFDQIRQTDKITVKCVNCDNDIKLYINEVSTQLFCNKCKNTKITKSHLMSLKQRLVDVSNRMLRAM